MMYQYFVANDLADGGTPAAPKFRLYVTDGTTAGTKPLISGSTSSGILPSNATDAGSRDYFVVQDASGSSEVWVTNGSSVTRLDPSPNSASDSYTSPFFFTPFTTPTGTQAVVFVANDLAAGGTVAVPKFALYVTDGTTGGTKALTSAGASPAYVAVSGNHVYFAVQDASGSTELWVTDGSSVTKLDPNPTNASDSYTNAFALTAFTTSSGAHDLAFVANDLAAGGSPITPKYQLYVTDGTTGGTHALTSGGASFGTLPSNLTVSGSRVYFTAQDSSGFSEIWVTDGSSVTKLDPNPIAASDSYSNVYDITPFTTATGAQKVVFAANDLAAGGSSIHPNYQLYVTDGTTGGTKALTSGGGTDGITPSDPTVSGNLVYFLAQDASGQTEVWVTDGSTVTKLDPNANSASDSYTYAVDLTSFTTASGVPEVAFVASNLTGGGSGGTTPYQLYVTDGTTGGTKALISSAAWPFDLTVSGGEIFFVLQDASGDSEVWVTNGSSVTKLDPSPSSASDSYAGAFDLTSFTTASGVQEVAFVANDLAAGGTAINPHDQLYVTDGTTRGTRALTSGGSAFNILAVNGSEVFFTATDASGGTEVWVTDGSSVTKLEPNPNSASDSYTYVDPAETVTYAIAAANAIKADGSSGTTSYTFTVTRSGPTYDMSEQAVLGFTVTGSGSNPAAVSMIENPSGVVTFDPGVSAVTLTINVSGAHLGADEGFTVTLSGHQSATGDVSTTTSSIANASASGLIEANGSSSLPSSHAAPADFLGDGTSDILFENSQSGLVLYWQMQNDTVQQGVPVYGASSGWNTVGTGDFNGNGTSDILFENSDSGLVLYWQMQNGALDKGVPIAGASAGWNVIGTGDFTGTGTDDILFQNSQSGLVLYWQMQNGALQQGVPLAGTTADWHFLGTGDFTGSGSDDILFENTNSGLLLYWQMQNGALTQGVPIAGATADWKYVGIGDFTGSGTDDILFQNKNTGAVLDWQMAHGSLAGGGIIAALPSGYQVAATGNYSGTATSDILLQNAATGSYMEWKMANGTLSQALQLGSAPSDWKLV